MKKFHILGLFAIATFFVLTAFNNVKDNIVPLSPAGNELNIPDDVQTIIDKSCYGCHNADAQSDKAKNKLMFEELSKLSKSKVVAKLGEIAEAVEENDMPPGKFLEKYPDKALSEEEATKLKAWAEKSADDFLK